MHDYCPLIYHVLLAQVKSTWNTGDSSDGDGDPGHDGTYTVFPKAKDAPQCDAHS